ncbi:MAG: alkyl hydroperoxide reductase [Legionellaceae bacterium]|nr:alkyl hydroperoxide reductase [Legionellaceae bacterium]
MNIETLKNELPEYAKDIKLNLSSLSNIQSLNEQQLYGTMLASALAAGNQQTIDAISETAKEHLDEAAITAAHAANSLMGMTNIYYRFIHLVDNDEYKKLPANLRMNFMANPGIDKADFELYSLAVSAITGCGLCIDSHEKGLRKHGLTAEQVQQGIRIAAIIHAVAKTISAQR